MKSKGLIKAEIKPEQLKQQKYTFVFTSTKKPDMPSTDPYHKWMASY